MRAAKYFCVKGQGAAKRAPVNLSPIKRGRGVSKGSFQVSVGQGGDGGFRSVIFGNNFLRDHLLSLVITCNQLWVWGNRPG